MKLWTTITVTGLLAAAFLLATQAVTPAQAPRAPSLGGIWRPIVGSGGAYEWTIGDDKHPLETTVVGKEDVDGKTGYWLETAATNPNSVVLYYKVLMVASDSGVTSMRTIVQRPGQRATEMDTTKSTIEQRTRPLDMRDQADLVGTETITVPAGTFSCEHYRAKDGSSEVWVSDKISPWGLVKTQSKNSSMVLTKVITDAKDHIIGPKKFDRSQAKGARKGQQAQ